MKDQFAATDADGCITEQSLKGISQIKTEKNKRRKNGNDKLYKGGPDCDQSFTGSASAIS